MDTVLACVYGWFGGGGDTVETGVEDVPGYPAPYTDPGRAGNGGACD